MVIVSLLSLAMACGPSKSLVSENQQLRSRVADLTSENARLHEDLEAVQKRLAELDQRRDGEVAQAIWEQLGIKPDGRLRAVIRTGQGDIRCDLWPALAPLTVLNFVQLAEGTKAWEDPRTGQRQTRPLYSGTTFHRVIPGFMIQGGDPLGTGAGGPGYAFKDEIAPSATFDRPGLLAMANAGPNTNGSQFFVTEGTPTHLNGKHTIFGDCHEDLSVVHAIASVPRKGEKPLEDVVIRKIEIQRGR